MFTSLKALSFFLDLFGICRIIEYAVAIGAPAVRDRLLIVHTHVVRRKNDAVLVLRKERYRGVLKALHQKASADAHIL